MSQEQTEQKKNERYYRRRRWPAYLVTAVLVFLATLLTAVIFDRDNCCCCGCGCSYPAKAYSPPMAKPAERKPLPTAPGWKPGVLPPRSPDKVPDVGRSAKPSAPTEQQRFGAVVPPAPPRLPGVPSVRSVQDVPEPMTGALVAAGGLLLARWKRS